VTDAPCTFVTNDLGLEVVVPDRLDVVTTFVLQEQGRWFEDEVLFVRGLLSEGQVVADVGANFGAYTLDAAHAVGPMGRVLAFEPSPQTAAMLRASVDRNRLPQVQVHEVALGARRGTASLALGSSPELAQLGAEGPSAEVEVRLLSDFADALAGLDFLKLDAEGTEEAIVRASAGWLQKEGPLVMFELRHGAQVNEGLIEAFKKIGFGLYQLCPGLDALVPFDALALDDFRLNLFAAPAPCAEGLATRDKLVLEAGRARTATEAVVRDWSAHRPLLRGTRDATPALAHWRAAHDPSLPLPDRYASLRAGFDLGPGVDDLAARLTFARIALELGQRVDALDAVVPLFEQEVTTPMKSFACPLPKYEEDAQFDAARIARAQVIEVRLRYGAFSSFYEPEDVFELLDQYREAGGHDEAITRREALLRQKWRR